MGRKKFCYWSVAGGQHARMMQTCVRSARAARVREDFHVWSDRAIAGAIAHDAGQFDKHLYHFKFDFLKKQAARLNYDYFVWLDADKFLCASSLECGGKRSATPLWLPRQKAQKAKICSRSGGAFI